MMIYIYIYSVLSINILNFTNNLIIDQKFFIFPDLKLNLYFRSRNRGRRRSRERDVGKDVAKGDDQRSMKDEVKEDEKADSSKTRKVSFVDAPRRLLVPITVKTEKSCKIYPETKVC